MTTERKTLEELLRDVKELNNKIGKLQDKRNTLLDGLVILHGIDAVNEAYKRITVSRLMELNLIPQQITIMMPDED